MKLFSALVILFLFLYCSFLYPQVTVAPVTVHLSDANKNSYIVVRNNSTTSPWEVSIEMKFGYPVSDSSGKTNIYFPEIINESDPSAVEWINFYPRKFILQPLEEQTVRIAAKPKDLKEGEYWGRPIIISHALNNFDTSQNQQISIGLGVEFRTVIALNYRKGKVSTGISLENITCTFDGNKFILFAKLKREGNAAYIGNIASSIKNEKGSTIKEVNQEISVYYELNKRIEIETGKLPKGTYTIDVQLNTDREEPGGKIIKGNTATKKITVNIN
jgi:hypothetical protein